MKYIAQTSISIIIQSSVTAYLKCPQLHDLCPWLEESLLLPAHLEALELPLPLSSQIVVQRSVIVFKSVFTELIWY